MKLSTLFYFLCGAVAGSFINVCIARLPRERSVVYPPSACDLCGYRLGLWDLLPVLSYLLLGGRCRYCGGAISLQVLWVEVITGTLFVWASRYSPFGWQLLLLWCFLGCLVLETFVDLREMIILDEALIVLFATGLCYAAFYHPLGLETLGGTLTGAAVLGTIHFLSNGGIGWGDVKFVTALGPWLGVSGMAVCLAGAFLLAGAAGFLLWLTGRVTGQSRIPFGPFLAVGAGLGFFYAPELLADYWSLFI